MFADPLARFADLYPKQEKLTPPLLSLPTFLLPLRRATLLLPTYSSTGLMYEKPETGSPHATTHRGRTLRNKLLKLSFNLRRAKRCSWGEDMKGSFVLFYKKKKKGKLCGQQCRQS